MYTKKKYIYTYFPLNIVRVFGVSQYLFLNKNPANILTACEKPFRVTSNADRPLSKGRDVTTFSAIFFQKRLPTKKKMMEHKQMGTVLLFKERSLYNYTPEV